MSKDCESPWTLSNLQALAEKEREENIRTDDELEVMGKLKGRLFKAVDAQAIEDLKYLFRNGCFPDQTDKHGRTPLLRASRAGLFDSVRWLCAHGAEPDEEKDRDGRSPFFLAVMNNHLNIAEWFLRRDSGDVNERDESGTSLLTYAAMQGNLALAKWLQEKGASSASAELDDSGGVKRQREEDFDPSQPPAKKTNYKKTEADLKEAVRLKDEGNAFLKQKDYKNAIKSYTEAMKHDPKWNVLYSNRAAAHTARKDYELAVFDGAKCIEIDPSWPKGYSRKATAHWFLKEYEQALIVYEGGLAVEPENQSFKDGVTNCKAKLGQE